MYDDITVAMVLWNEAHRLRGVVDRVRPYVHEIVVGVQESQDGTLELAREITDRVVPDRCHGYGDATFGPLVLPQVRTRWTLKVDGDELPSVELMDSLGNATLEADAQGKVGVWIPFRSWIDDVEWASPHSHLRLFHTKLGWPATLHSRPMTENTNHWTTGWIEHRKSLDEHVKGYLTYLDVGRGNPGWDDHNRGQIWHACSGIAALKGWDYVTAHEWWPRVEPILKQSGLPVPEL